MQILGNTEIKKTVDDEQRYEIWKLAGEVSRERHMKNISPVQSILHDASIWTFYGYNNKYIYATQEFIKARKAFIQPPSLCNDWARFPVRPGPVQHLLM